MLETNKRTVRRRLEEALVAAVGANGGAPGHERLEALVERTDPGTLVDFAIAQRVTGPASQSLPDLLTDVPARPVAVRGQLRPVL